MMGLLIWQLQENVNQMSRIKIDLERDDNITPFGIATIQDRYLIENETSPQHAFARASKYVSTYHGKVDWDMAQRMYEYASKQWFGFSSPILSNAGTKKGLPISCFLNYVPDSREGLSEHYNENIWLASNGGGIGGYWGAVRSDGTATTHGSKSTGSIPFIKVVDSQMLAFNQGTTRRGSYAGYMDISHPEIEEFLFMRKSSGGDANRKCLNLHHGINITDKFMDAVSKNIDWDLIDPHSNEVIKSLNARNLWRMILETRHETGEPYLHFIDTSNRYLPDKQKKLGLKVNQSNLCSEITLATAEDRTAVCCLSSVNLAKYDKWSSSPTFIPDMVRMLDNVLEHFILAVYDFSFDMEGNIKDIVIKESMTGFERAGYSAFRERSIGLGAMGFHTYLQKLNIPFDSDMATGQNMKMFKYIKEKSVETSKKLAIERGEAPDMEGTGMRHAHLLAIAPNATSSIICGGTSPSIEPIRANVYSHKTLSGTFQVRNKHLHELFKVKWEESEDLQKEYDNDYVSFKDKVWKHISEHHGSVKHLKFLTEWEKSVFKTADEIDQHWIVEHASQRQQYICQAQSVNLFFVAPPIQSSQDDHNNFLRYSNKVHFEAWKKGLKSLYYLRSREAKSAENINLKVKRIKLDEEMLEKECLSCQA